MGALSQLFLKGRAVCVVPLCEVATLLTGWVCACDCSCDVKSHCIKWSQTFQFHSKMYASPSTGELEPCYCKVSIRKVSTYPVSLHHKVLLGVWKFIVLTRLLLLP